MVPDARRSRLCLLPSVWDFRWVSWGHWANTDPLSCSSSSPCLGEDLEMAQTIGPPRSVCQYQVWSIWSAWPNSWAIAKGLWLKIWVPKIPKFSKRQNWFTYFVPDSFGSPSQVGVLSDKGCDVRIPANSLWNLLSQRCWHWITEWIPRLGRAAAVSMHFLS